MGLNTGIAKIDQRLSVSNRSLRSYPGRLLFGPAGDRLFADYVEKKPGFLGRFDFIHKCNITSLFTVEPEGGIDFASAECVWHPSCMTMDYEDGDVAFHEIKVIAKDDTAYSVQTWENKSGEPLTLTLKAEPEGCELWTEIVTTALFWRTPVLSHGFGVLAACLWNASDSCLVTVEPGMSLTFTACACVGNSVTENAKQLLAKAKSSLPAPGGEEALLERLAGEYQRFFDGLPEFTCSDEVLSRTWDYRWYILKNCIARPRFGYLKRTVMYEGRGHKTGKAPLAPKGWQFCRLICLSTPLQLTDLKWCGDDRLIQNVILSFFDCQDEDGIVNSAFVDHFGSPFCNFIGRAAYQAFLISGDLSFAREILPKLKKLVFGNRSLYRSENDELQIEVRHQRTGKEYQPSYWYFSGYPMNPKEEGAFTPLKRVDRTIYHYWNVWGLVRLMKAAGEDNTGDYEELVQLEQLLREQINEKMWDPETKFYYDLHYQTDEKALVKNIVGVYPYWAGIAGQDQKEGIKYLFDPEYFAAGSAFTTVAKDCPAYSPAGGWRGIIRSRNGCVWDGPSWPYTNGIALDAAAEESRRQGHAYDREFSRYLRDYSLQHFEGRDLNRPYLVEQYHPATGEPLSDEPDYNHSYYLDLLISQVCGLKVEPGRLVIDPIDIGLTWFRLAGVHIRGIQVSIEYAAEKDRGGIRKGFRAYLDGQKACEEETLCRMELPLPMAGTGASPGAES